MWQISGMSVGNTKGILDVTMICLWHWRMSVVSHPSCITVFFLKKTLSFKILFKFSSWSGFKNRKSMGHISTCLIIVLYATQLVMAREVWFLAFLCIYVYKQILIIFVHTKVNYKLNNYLLQVPVYYLNADFDYRRMIDYNSLDIDCVHTVEI